jgi:FkbM family methyltransferase
MNKTINKEQLLELLERAQKDYKEFQEKYMGSGWIKRFKRLWRYKLFYIRYILEQFAILHPKINYYYLLRSGVELKVIRYLLKILKPSDCFYDVGANYGLFVDICVNIIKEEGEIHCFEPLPNCFSYLKKKFGSFKNILLNNVALGDKNQIVNFYQDLFSGTSGSSTLLEDVVKKNLRKHKTISVNMITLDDYLKIHRKPDFIKLDVEGSESLVIKGGYDFFKNDKPIIIMEIWSGDNGLNFSMKAVEMLYEMGYKSYFVTEDGNLQYFSKEDVINWIKNSKVSNDNFVFKKE